MCSRLTSKSHSGLVRDEGDYWLSRKEIIMAKISPPVMRAITGLELAAELYRRRMSDLGSVLTLSLTNPKKDSQALSLRIGINGDLMGGMKAPIEVGRKRMDIAYVNPTAMVAMAYRGKGYYKEKMPLRVLAAFPSWGTGLLSS
jgi:hypothetical protein